MRSCKVLRQKLNEIRLIIDKIFEFYWEGDYFLREFILKLNDPPKDIFLLQFQVLSNKYKQSMSSGSNFAMS